MRAFCIINNIEEDNRSEVEVSVEKTEKVTESRAKKSYGIQAVWGRRALEISESEQKSAQTLWTQVGLGGTRKEKTKKEL